MISSIAPQRQEDMQPKMQRQVSTFGIRQRQLVASRAIMIRKTAALNKGGTQEQHNDRRPPTREKKSEKK